MPRPQYTQNPGEIASSSTWSCDSLKTPRSNPSPGRVKPRLLPTPNSNRNNLDRVRYRERALPTHMERPDPRHMFILIRLWPIKKQYFIKWAKVGSNTFTVWWDPRYKRPIQCNQGLFVINPCHFCRGLLLWHSLNYPEIKLNLSN